MLTTKNDLMKKLSEKMLIITEKEKFDDEIENKKMFPRYPFCCYKYNKNANFLETPYIDTTLKHRMEKVSFSPLVETVKTYENNSRKKMMAVENRQIKRVALYIPMKRSPENEYVINFNRDYKALIDALFFGLTYPVLEEILINYQTIHPEAESVNDLPEGMISDAYTRVEKIINKFDAFEIVQGKDIQPFGGLKGFGLPEDETYEMRTAYLYSMNEKAENYEEMKELLDTKIRAKMKEEKLKASRTKE